MKMNFFYQLQDIGSLNSVQKEVNLLYNDLCNIVKNKLLQKLPHRHVILNYGLANKRRRHKKPWGYGGFAVKKIQVYCMRVCSVYMKHVLRKSGCITRLFAYCKGGNFNIHIWALFGYFIS